MFWLSGSGSYLGSHVCKFPFPHPPHPPQTSPWKTFYQKIPMVWFSGLGPYHYSHAYMPLPFRPPLCASYHHQVASFKTPSKLGHYSYFCKNPTVVRFSGAESYLCMTPFLLVMIPSDITNVYIPPLTQNWVTMIYFCKSLHIVWVLLRLL